LDASLETERAAAFRFTAAHEIGHWILHRYNYKNWNFQSHNETSGGLQDDDTTLCRLENRTQSDWLEFQANVFAASLVMPREMFIVALKQTQIDIGIDKNIGRIYLSNAPYSRRDYETTVSQLAQIFHVSKKSVRVRIKTLRLIEGEDRSENKTYRINPFTVLTSLQN
jgi:Zn-dependent peptidase ImmA (M78 family)